MNAAPEATSGAKHSMLWHLARKDLRYARIWLLLTWLLSALPLILMRGAPQETRVISGSAIENWSKLSWGFAIAGGVLAAVRLFQLDRAPFLSRSSSFMATRPLSWGALAGAKLLVIVSGLILPICAARLVFLSIFQLPMSSGDYISIALGDGLFITSIFFAALMPALWLRSLGGYIALMTLLGGIYILGMLAFWRHSISGVDHIALQQLWQSRTTVMQIALVLGAVGVIFLCSRSRKAVINAMATTAVLAGCLWMFWPWNFVRNLSDKGPVAILSEWPDSTGITIEWAKTEADQFVKFTDVSFPKERYHWIQGRIIAQGIPEPWYLSQRSYHSTLNLQTGRKLSQIDHDSPAAERPIYEAILKARTGHSFEKWEPRLLQLFEYTSPSVASAQKHVLLQGATILELRRAFILHEFPLRNGESFHAGQMRFTLQRVHLSEQIASFDLIEEEPNDRLRGGSWLRQSNRRLVAVLVNDAKREFVAVGKAEMRWLTAATYVRGQRSFEFDPSRAPHTNMKAFSADWLDGAKLLLISSESGGEMTVPFHFNLPVLPL